VRQQASHTERRRGTDRCCDVATATRRARSEPAQRGHATTFVGRTACRHRMPRRDPAAQTAERHERPSHRGLVHGAEARRRTRHRYADAGGRAVRLSRRLSVQGAEMRRGPGRDRQPRRRHDLAFDPDMRELGYLRPASPRAMADHGEFETVRLCVSEHDGDAATIEDSRDGKILQAVDSKMCTTRPANGRAQVRPEARCRTGGLVTSPGRVVRTLS
jgi:hypothetical protein